jgi:1-deoxy-D-xylulose-5-phosphate synthase
MKTITRALLDSIKSVSDIKNIKRELLPLLSEEIRNFIIQSVSKTGGHLGAPLGVVELTVALHYVLSSPDDKIVWDVGHQAYAHKILTGRKNSFHTLRQYKGISGFPKISESSHDAFGTGHASTSLSAALGIAKARDLAKEPFEVIAVIGDGSMTGGNALEALNQIGYLNTKLIVILNDNRMSISPNVGMLSEYTHRIEHTEIYKNVRETINELIEQGNGLKQRLIELKKYLKDVGSPGLLFEKLGLNYIGPVDGHNMPELITAIEKAKATNGPSLIHVNTIKGKGYRHAEDNKARFHGVNPFDVESGNDIACNGTQTFTEVFADAMIEIAETNKKIIGITAAMPDGTGLSKFKKIFPERFFDAGIAEQHAVVFAAGLAKQDFIPVCAIYSSFLQRAYDAIVHDVCLQNLPVIFAIDRAGLVGADGPTHHGSFDISFLRHIPNLVIMAPSDTDELRDMLYTAVQLQKPIAIRYPRGCCSSHTYKPMKLLSIGEAEVICSGSDITLISIGTTYPVITVAAEHLQKKGVSVSLINARFVKPLDLVILEHIAKTKNAIIVEENAVQGGFGSSILEACSSQGVRGDIRLVGIPDTFVEHGSQQILRENCGISAANVISLALSMVGLPQS